MLIILTCLLCALICVMGLMVVIRCTWACPQSPIPQVTTNEVVPNECLKRKIVKSLPKRIFKSGDLIVAAAAAATSENDKAAAECVICLAEFADGEEVREFPGCGHVFHIECIDTWLIGSNSSSCPSCRRVLVVNQSQTCRNDVSVVPQQQEADSLRLEVSIRQFDISVPYI